MKWLHVMLAVLLTGAILAAIAALDTVEIRRQQRVRADEQADYLAAQLSSVLSSKLMLVRGLAAFAETRDDFTEDEFQSFAAVLSRGQTGIRSLQLAPNAVVRFLTNPKLNAKSRGHDLLADPDRRALGPAAIDRREYIIAGPIDLIQGGSALIGRWPIFKTDASGAESFWGFSTVLLDMPQLLEDAGLLDTSLGVRIALRGKDGRGADGEVFFGDASLFDDHRVIAEVMIPNGSWQLVATSAGPGTATYPRRAEFLSGSGALAVLIGAIFYGLLRRPAGLRLAMEVLRERGEARIHAIASNVPGAVYHQLVRSSGEVEYPYISDGFWALSRRTGPPAGEPGGDAIAAVLHPADRPRWEDEVREASRLRRRYELEVRLAPADGPARWVRLAAHPRSGSGPEVCEWDGIALDITDRRRAEDELRQAQKMEAVGQLTGGIAHDFNNLLTVVVGNVELAKNNAQTPADVRSLLADAEEAAERGADLVRQLLAFSRKQPLSPEVCDLNELVTTTAGLLRRSLGEQIELVCELGDAMWPVLVDSGQLQNTLINLSLNARDAMTSGGCLTIRTEKRPANVSASGLEAADCVLLSVIDDGAGMSEETLEQAFDPFFTTKPPGEGSGLGLSGAYGFVRQSGGSIEVESELGVGTRVFVMLPRTDQPLAHPRDIAAARAKVSASRSVLLVEDDMAARATVTAMLTQLGHRVTAAEDAPAALRLLETTPFDILVTDIGLPGGMSGDQLADRARSMRPIHIVCVTGYANDPIAERIRDRGYRLLSKPVRMQDLANALDAARHPAS